MELAQIVGADLVSNIGEGDDKSFMFTDRMDNDLHDFIQKVENKEK